MASDDFDKYINDVEAQYKEAKRAIKLLDLFEKANKQAENPEWPFKLAELYESWGGNHFVKFDVLKCYTEAANRGHVEAPFRLAEMFERGKGVVANKAEARKWYFLAATRGNQRAAHWCRSRAEKGDPACQFTMGQLTEARRDFVQAAKWYRLAAAQGHGEAHGRFVALYNNPAVRERFRVAAEAGNVEACGQLSYLYKNGLGVPQSDEEAERWIRKANEVARQGLDELEVPEAVPEKHEERVIVLPGGVEMEMAWCPPGSFWMGSPEHEKVRDSDEIRHRVTLSEGFWMAKHPVTQRQWKSVMGDNPSQARGNDRPVECVSWEECREFCRKAGHDLRLPTEAQWEYACRAGGEGPYAGTGDVNEMGWHRENAKGETHPVGQKPSNAFGLYDMHGNVFEWCEDWCGTYPREPVTDPTGSSSGNERVVRGGSWMSVAAGCRSAKRVSQNPDARCNDVGFRPIVCGRLDSQENNAPR